MMMAGGYLLWVVLVLVMLPGAGEALLRVVIHWMQHRRAVCYHRPRPELVTLRELERGRRRRRRHPCVFRSCASA